MVITQGLGDSNIVIQGYSAEGADAPDGETDVSAGPTPTIAFQVRLYSTDFYPGALPDSLATIRYVRQLTTLYIPGIPQVLHDGDTFSLQGELAYYTKTVYVDQLGLLVVTSTELI